jgi:hypothetical protein
MLLSYEFFLARDPGVLSRAVIEERASLCHKVRASHRAV